MLSHSKSLGIIYTSTSGGAGQIAGTVDTYAELPAAADHTQEFYLVRNGTGIYLINRKPAGLYYSDGSTWESAPDIIPFFSDANLDIYNSVDDTKVIDFDASAITAGNDRTIKMADEDIDLADIPDNSDRITLLELTPVAVKTANYSAGVQEFIPCNVVAGGFTVTLPTTPTDGSLIMIQSLNIVSSANVLKIETGGADVLALAGGPTFLYIGLALETVSLQYNSGLGVWHIEHTAPPSNFATNFPGIDAQTPLTSSDISINTTTRVLTVTPPLGYFQFTVDGNGKATRYRKDAAVDFPAFTDTSGEWFFYFDSSGDPISTQTPWTTSDFSTIAPVYRIRWNATLSGAAKLVDEYIEFHENTIPASDHEWKHLYGAIWESGLAMTNNAQTSGLPNADGSQTVIALSTGVIMDDNLAYTVTNDSTPTLDWEQDMGDTNAGTLDATNSGLFEVYLQDGAGLISYIAATRFPFTFSGSNIIEYITSTGTRTEVTNNYFAVVFVYANQNPRVGETVKLVSAPQDFATITGARAYTWTDIQNTYSILGNDGEVRPLYRLIFERKSSYDVAVKYAALRETQDLRKAAVTSTTAASGSLPASSVTVVPAGNIASTNAQAALEELDSEKLAVDGSIALAGAWDMGSQSLTNVNIDSGVITGITDLAVADGGTGASNAGDARTNLGLVIGTDVLAEQTIGIADNNLVEIDSADVADDEFARFTANGLESRSNAEMKTQLAYMTDLVDDTTPQLSGDLDCQANHVGFTQQTVTYASGTTTVDWGAGNKAKMTFGAGNITTFAFTNPAKPSNLLLVIVQDATGSRVVSAWDADIKWPGGTAPTLSTGANAIDIISFYFDGTNYFGVMGSGDFS